MGDPYANAWILLLIQLLYYILINHHANGYSKVDNRGIFYRTSPRFSLPPKREFITLPKLEHSFCEDQKDYRQNILSKLRVLQFNMLADGLSGLRTDLGAFSRAKMDDLKWEIRKSKLLYELLQYDPDVITMQECDHYYDFFLPQLSIQGYDGMFAPKPASACLEVSDNSDGCVIFYKRNKLQVISTETLTYALSKSEISLESNPSPTTYVNDETKLARAQNQVALVVMFELIANETNKFYPKIILSTTHLKAAKTAQGEKYRHVEMQQLLAAVSKCYVNSLYYPTSKEHPNKSASVVIITGDLNACPTQTTEPFGFECTAYSLLKKHPFQFRSVMNDDLVEELQMRNRKNLDSKETDNRKKDDLIWTSWKVRRKGGTELIVKNCIDYILYSTCSPLLNENSKDVMHDTASSVSISKPSPPPQQQQPTHSMYFIRASHVLNMFKDEDIGYELLPTSWYPSDHIALVADLEIIEKVPLLTIK